MRDSFIVETEDEVYYDAESADDCIKDLFISNIKALLTEDDAELFDSLTWQGAEALKLMMTHASASMPTYTTSTTAGICTTSTKQILT